MLEKINMEGTITKWVNKKGYGFIGVEGQKDVFVHHSDIKMDGFVNLKLGQKVKFDIEASDRGLRSKNVELIE